MPWSDERLPGRIRFKLLQLDQSAEEVPRYYWPDVQAFMVQPAMRRAMQFSPVFTAPACSQRSFHRPTAAELEPRSSLWRIEAAAHFLDLVRDSIEDRMIEWQDEYVPFRIRSGKTELNVGLHHVRVCYGPDVEALLKVPAPLNRPL